MPTAFFAHASTYLAEQAAVYPHLIITPIYEPEPRAVEEAGFRFWVAGAINGSMHWRFKHHEDAVRFAEQYGE